MSITGVVMLSPGSHQVRKAECLGAAYGYMY